LPRALVERKPQCSKEQLLLGDSTHIEVEHFLSCTGAEAVSIINGKKGANGFSFRISLCSILFLYSSINEAITLGGLETKGNYPQRHAP